MLAPRFILAAPAPSVFFTDDEEDGWGDEDEEDGWGDEEEDDFGFDTAVDVSEIKIDAQDANRAWS